MATDLEFFGSGKRVFNGSHGTGGIQEIDVTKLLITVAAASIAFGGNQNGKAGILIAKFTLAFSILYGVLFCAAVLYMYDEYGQNLEVYTRFWYSTVETLGFSALICFVVGYGVWALNVG
jgi:hypothetical protein